MRSSTRRWIVSWSVRPASRGPTPTSGALALATRSRACHTDALALAEQTFPAALRSRVWSGLDAGEGRRVDRYLSDYTARLEGAGEPRALVESNVPLRATDGSGRKAPVALALEDRGGHFESVNPLVAVRYSKDPAQGVSLARSGVGVSVEGVAEDAVGVARGDRLAIADALEDGDFWASPDPGRF